MNIKPFLSTNQLSIMPDFEPQNNQLLLYTKAINELVLNEAEEVALGSLYQTVSNAIGLGTLNATVAQQNSNITAQAVTALAATMICSESAVTDNG